MLLFASQIQQFLCIAAGLASTGRDVLAACSSVQTRSNYIDLDGNGQIVHVGSQHELWAKIQQLKVSFVCRFKCPSIFLVLVFGGGSETLMM